ncbi:Retinol dehydrogenase 13 [Desmophyllum pertusum]|uniref:Retinol dehydrogenase 13 n=1 Tax=Desmophyllum pertusum TaxID=174260 RepID=A0A9W9YS52_9CNID|nr:Retinol dehydrogenase 13 [Desmophyllum pertusum]
MRSTGVTVYVLRPGPVRTEIWRNWTLLHKPYIKPFVLMLAWLFFKDCKQGAQTTIYCSVAEELNGVSGLYYSDCRVDECNKLAKDPGLAKKLWDVSERFTGESWKD